MSSTKEEIASKSRILENVLHKRTDNADTGILWFPIDKEQQMKFLPAYAGKFPQKLYRYRKPNPVFLLEEIREAAYRRRVYTSKFENFIDKEELRPSIVDAPEESYRKVIEFCFSHDRDWVFPDLEMRELSRFLKVPYFSLVKELRDNPARLIQNARTWARSDLDGIRASKGCACFCKSSNSKDMWADYAQDGSGVCLVFTLDNDKLEQLENSEEHFHKWIAHRGNISEASIGDSPGWLYNWEIVQYLFHINIGDVQYKESKPDVLDLDINISASMHPNKYIRECLKIFAYFNFKSFKDHTTRTLFTKTCEYSYEDEWRLFRKKGDAYTELPIYQLSDIVLGANIDHQLAYRVKECADTAGISVIKA